MFGAYPAAFWSTLYLDIYIIYLFYLLPIFSQILSCIRYVHVICVRSLIQFNLQHHGSLAVPCCAVLGAEAALQPLQQQALPAPQLGSLHGGGGGQGGQPGAVHSPHQGVSLER